jgi:hypothetical protein
VNILDTNASPVFINEPYKGTINEDDLTDSSILTVEATDADIGNNAVLSFEVLADASKAENNFKLNKLAGLNQAVLKVQSPKDREGMTGNVMTFKIRVVDGGGASDTSTVTVTVNNVNDNKPTFTKELYSFEMMYNDTKGHVLGSVTCTDKDVGKLIHDLRLYQINLQFFHFMLTIDCFLNQYIPFLMQCQSLHRSGRPLQIAFCPTVPETLNFNSRLFINKFIYHQTFKHKLDSEKRKLRYCMDSKIWLLRLPKNHFDQLYDKLTRFFLGKLYCNRCMILCSYIHFIFVLFLKPAFFSAPS